MKNTTAANPIGVLRLKTQERNYTLLEKAIGCGVVDSLSWVIIRRTNDEALELRPAPLRLMLIKATYAIMAMNLPAHCRI